MTQRRPAPARDPAEPVHMGRGPAGPGTHLADRAQPHGHRLCCRRRRITMAVGRNEVQLFPDRLRPPRRPTGQDRRRRGQSDGLRVRRPERLGVVAGRKAPRPVFALSVRTRRRVRVIQPPIRTQGWIDRKTNVPLVVTPDGRYLVGAVTGLHPDDRGPKNDAAGNRIWRTASILVWETASGRVVRKVDVNADASIRSWASRRTGIRSPPGSRVGRTGSKG